LYRIESKIDTNSAEFKKNKEEFSKVLSRYKSILQNVKHGASEKAVSRHKKRGKRNLCKGNYQETCSRPADSY